MKKVATRAKKSAARVAKKPAKVASQPQTVSKKSSSLLFPIAIAALIVAVLAGIGGYKLSQKRGELMRLSWPAQDQTASQETVHWKTYTNDDGKISFQAPANSRVTVTPGLISVKFGEGAEPDTLNIAYAAGSKKPQGYDGVSQPGEDASDGGKVIFLDTELQKVLLMTDMQVAEILYSGNSATSRIVNQQGLNFLITMEWGASSEQGITAEHEAWADQVISSLHLQP